MSPRQKILAIRLSEKILQNPDYAKSIGIEINNFKQKTTGRYYYGAKSKK